MRRKPADGEMAARRTHFIQLGLDQFGDELGPAFRALAELYIARSGDVVALFDAGERTLIHGDDHSGNLFVDAGRTGFFDWAIASRAPGVRDVAYFMCNSLPIEVRRAHERPLLARYRDALTANGWPLDEQTAHDQYRIFSIYSWIAAVSTAAMGTQWQPRRGDAGCAAQHDGRDRGPRRDWPAPRTAVSVRSARASSMRRTMVATVSSAVTRMTIHPSSRSRSVLLMS
jgi:Phosphotransferase enzyme family